MAAPYVNQITFCRLSSFPRIFGSIGSIRTTKSIKNYKKDLKPSQQYKNDPARIDEQPGPWKNYTDVREWRKRQHRDMAAQTQTAVNLDELLAEINFETEDDMPVDIPDPYVKPYKRCLLCEHNVEVTYKNPQLLSQFVSTYSGRIYGRHVTGLCLHMQRRVASEIKVARRLGFMPSLYKTPKYFEDPALFNPFTKKSFPPGE